MKKYKTGGYGELIEEVEIVRETEKSVFVKDLYGFNTGRVSREAKRCSYSNYFDTMKEAKDFLKQRFEDKIKSHEQQIESANKSLAKVEKY